MSTSTFFIKPIPKQIVEAIEARGKYIQSITPSRTSIQWENEKHHYCRIVSQCVIVDKNGNQEGKEKRLDWTLSGMRTDSTSVFGQTSRYSTDSNIPNPGLTSLKIENKGTMGSTKKITIDFVCWDLSQLEKLEAYYMSIGKNVYVEYGWNYILEPNGNIKPTVLRIEYTDNPKQYTDVASDNKDIEINTYGCQGIYQGLVTNFSWKMRNDGGFDCSTTLVSMGDAWLATNIDIFTQNKSAPTVSDDELRLPVNNLMGRLLELRESEGDGNSDFKYKNSGAKIPHLYANKWTKKKGDWYHAGMNVEFELIKYIKFSEFLKILNESIATVNVTLGQYDASYDTGPINVPVFENQISTDPRICILPGHMTPNIAGADETVWHGTFDAIDSIIQSTGQTDYNFVNTNDQTVGDLSKSLISVEFLIKLVDETKRSDELMERVLSGISSVCGNKWVFAIDPEPYNFGFIDPSQGQKIHIIEISMKPEEKSTTLSPIEFKVFNRASFIRSIEFHTDLTTDIANQAIAEARTENQKSNTNGGQNHTYSFFSYEVNDLVQGNNILHIAPLNGISRANNTSPSRPHGGYNNLPRNGFGKEATEKSYNRQVSTTGDNPDIDNKSVASILKKNLDQCRLEMSDENIKSLTTTINFCIENHIYLKNNPNITFSDIYKKSVINKELTDKTRSQILPLKLSLTIDGFTGLKPGNLFTIDYMPKRYKENDDYFLCFVITNIIQDLTVDDWTTRIEGFFRKQPK